jgi:excisionase family DNA binding protein
MLTTREAAELLNVTTGRVRFYINRGLLPARRGGATGQGRDWLIQERDLQNFSRRPAGRPARRRRRRQVLPPGTDAAA